MLPYLLLQGQLRSPPVLIIGIDECTYNGAGLDGRIVQLLVLRGRDRIAVPGNISLRIAEIDNTQEAARCICFIVIEFK